MVGKKISDNPTASSQGQSLALLRCPWSSIHQWLTYVSPFRFRAEGGNSPITKSHLGPDPTFHVCEYIGGPNLALKRPTFCKEEETAYENCKLEWVNNGIFPTTSKYWYGDFWHGRGTWVYLQITLDKFYAIKTVIFQSR